MNIKEGWGPESFDHFVCEFGPIEHRYIAQAVWRFGARVGPGDTDLGPPGISVTLNKWACNDHVPKRLNVLEAAEQVLQRLREFRDLIP